MSISDNIARVHEIIANACARSNRNPEDITLVAVSKQKPSTVVLEAMAAGVQHFGENRVEESMQKIPAVMEHPDSIRGARWHMIGHIQSRKVKHVVPIFDTLHSVDSVKIAQKLSQLAQVADKTIIVMLEINISGEEAKHGFDLHNWQQSAEKREAFWQVFDELHQLPNLDIRGLMTMAPYYDNSEDTRPVFADLAALKETLSGDFGVTIPDLSMGMTNDYHIAIEEGATIVRIGRAIFGERI